MTLRNKIVSPYKDAEQTLRGNTEDTTRIEECLRCTHEEMFKAIRGLVQAWLPHRVGVIPLFGFQPCKRGPVAYYRYFPLILELIDQGIKLSNYLLAKLYSNSRIGYTMHSEGLTLGANGSIFMLHVPDLVEVTSALKYEDCLCHVPSHLVDRQLEFVNYEEIEFSTGFSTDFRLRTSQVSLSFTKIIINGETKEVERPTQSIDEMVYIFTKGDVVHAASQVPWNFNSDTRLGKKPTYFRREHLFTRNIPEQFIIILRSLEELQVHLPQFNIFVGNIHPPGRPTSLYASPRGSVRTATPLQRAQLLSKAMYQLEDIGIHLNAPNSVTSTAPRDIVIFQKTINFCQTIYHMEALSNLGSTTECRQWIARRIHAWLFHHYEVQESPFSRYFDRHFCHEDEAHTSDGSITREEYAWYRSVIVIAIAWSTDCYFALVEGYTPIMYDFGNLIFRRMKTYLQSTREPVHQRIESTEEERKKFVAVLASTMMSTNSMKVETLSLHTAYFRRNETMKAIWPLARETHRTIPIGKITAPTLAEFLDRIRRNPLTDTLTPSQRKPFSQISRITDRFILDRTKIWGSRRTNCYAFIRNGQEETLERAWKILSLLSRAVRQRALLRTHTVSATGLGITTRSQQDETWQQVEGVRQFNHQTRTMQTMLIHLFADSSDIARDRIDHVEYIRCAFMETLGIPEKRSSAILMGLAYMNSLYALTIEERQFHEDERGSSASRQRETPDRMEVMQSIAREIIRAQNRPMVQMVLQLHLEMEAMMQLYHHHQNDWGKALRLKLPRRWANLPPDEQGMVPLPLRTRINSSGAFLRHSSVLPLEPLDIKIAITKLGPVSILGGVAPHKEYPYLRIIQRVSLTLQDTQKQMETSDAEIWLKEFLPQTSRQSNLFSTEVVANIMEFLTERTLGEVRESYMFMNDMIVQYLDEMGPRDDVKPRRSFTSGFSTLRRINPGDSSICQEKLDIYLDILTKQREMKVRGITGIGSTAESTLYFLPGTMIEEPHRKCIKDSEGKLSIAGHGTGKAISTQIPLLVGRIDSLLEWHWHNLRLFDNCIYTGNSDSNIPMTTLFLSKGVTFRLKPWHSCEMHIQFLSACFHITPHQLAHPGWDDPLYTLQFARHEDGSQYVIKLAEELGRYNEEKTDPLTVLAILCGAYSKIRHFEDPNPPMEVPEIFGIPDESGLKSYSKTPQINYSVPKLTTLIQAYELFVAETFYDGRVFVVTTNLMDADERSVIPNYQVKRANAESLLCEEMQRQLKEFPRMTLDKDTQAKLIVQSSIVQPKDQRHSRPPLVTTLRNYASPLGRELDAEDDG